MSASVRPVSPNPKWGRRSHQHPQTSETTSRKPMRIRGSFATSPATAWGRLPGSRLFAMERSVDGEIGLNVDALLHQRSDAAVLGGDDDAGTIRERTCDGAPATLDAPIAPLPAVALPFVALVDALPLVALPFAAAAPRPYGRFEAEDVDLPTAALPRSETAGQLSRPLPSACPSRSHGTGENSMCRVHTYPPVIQVIRRCCSGLYDVASRLTKCVTLCRVLLAFEHVTEITPMV
jgi:hypothetical protein